MTDGKLISTGAVEVVGGPSDLALAIHRQVVREAGKQVGKELGPDALIEYYTCLTTSILCDVTATFGELVAKKMATAATAHLAEIDADIYRAGAH